MPGVNAISGWVGRWLADAPGAGRIGLSIRDDRSGEVVEHDPGAVFPSASMIKLAIAAAVLEDGLADSVAVCELDRARGDGLLREWTLPISLPVRDLVSAMTVISDNTATNALLRHLGVEQLNERLERWGYTVTRSLGPVPGAEQSGGAGIGTTSAGELVPLIDELIAGRFGSSQDASWYQGVLERQQDDRALSRYLAPGARFAHKTGTWRTVRHDAGALFGRAGDRLLTIAVLTEGLGPDVERHDHPAVLAMGALMLGLVRELELPVDVVPYAPPTRPWTRPG